MSEWAPKRFWTSVQVETDDAGFLIHLDARPVRTPAKKMLVVPTQEIADKIAAEWDAQEDAVDPGTMPWTKSANAAIDKVAEQANEVRGHLAGYADTDLLLYRAESPAALIERQAAQWNPVLDWISETYGARLQLAEGVMPVSQDAEALLRLTKVMDDMTDFQLTGFHDLVTLTGSFALALAAKHRFQSAEQIWTLSRVDEDWQIEQWGHDEEATMQANFKKASFIHANDFFHAT